MNKDEQGIRLVKGTPTGMKQCPVCGEYQGSVYARDLDWGGSAYPPNEPYLTSVTT